MHQHVSDRDAATIRALDALRITPQHFLDFQHGLGKQAVSTVRLEPVLIRASRIRWPFTEFWKINLDTFNQGLRTTFDALGVGYCYKITRNGKLAHAHASGSAQLLNDGNIPWGLDIPANCGSVTKLVTAIATIRLLRSANIPATTPIAGFLPQYWSQGPGVGAITFHQLLRHEAGLGKGVTDSGGGEFADAKAAIAIGSSGSTKYDYKNLNFAILRVLFATLTTTLSPSSPTPSFLSALGISDDTFWDLTSASVYSNVVNENVFAPAGLTSRDFEPATNAAKAYATPPVVPGFQPNDGAGGSGPSGWHFSMDELLLLLDEFRAGSMMPRWRAEQLLSNQYGLDGPVITQAGPVYYKGGRKVDNPTTPMRGIDAAIYLMPDDVDFAILVNSLKSKTTSHLDAIPQLITTSIEFSLFAVFH